MLQTQQRIHERGLVVFGVDLTDAREELFVRMVCDGIAIGLAFIKAGFKEADGKSKNLAAHRLFHLPRVQQRAAAILEARRTTGVVTLPEVTDMLNRVFSKALHDDQMNAAHNAAFSLARLYGHVTDRAIVETVRKPSRDPDAPAERSLTNWIDALPLKGPSPEGPDNSPVEAGPASPRAAIGEGSGLATYARLGLEGSSPEVPGLAADPADRHPQFGNGAPVGPVTGASSSHGRTGPLAKAAKADVSRETKASPHDQKRTSKKSKVPVLSGAMKRKKRRMKDLFG